MVHLTRPSVDDLREARCLERVDIVSGDPRTTAFKAAARLHQARWREAQGHPIGTHPIAGGPLARPLGSRLPLDYAKHTGANFIDPRCARAAAARIAQPQKHQLLDEQRLYADLLSSMPMCFNLFGSLADANSCTSALRRWWPDTPGRVTQTIFEWSPGRADPRYLGNRTSFDVAFILELDSGQRGLLAVETKYHEHPTPPPRRNPPPRVGEVARNSDLFSEEALATLPHDLAWQIWLDHLLALSLLQQPSGEWGWVRFVLVYPDANPSWQALAARYRCCLRDDQTFAATTLDTLLNANALEPKVNAALTARYRCWSTSAVLGPAAS